MSTIKKLLNIALIFLVEKSLYGNQLAPIIIRNNSPVNISVQILYAFSAKPISAQKISAGFHSPSAVIIPAKETVTVPSQEDNGAFIGFSHVHAINVKAGQIWGNHKGNVLLFSPEMISLNDTYQGFKNAIYTDKNPKTHLKCKAPQKMVFEIDIVPKLKKPPLNGQFIKSINKHTNFWPSITIKYNGCQK